MSEPLKKAPATTAANAAVPLKVWLLCTGVGVVDRGIETFARDCFDGLRDGEGLSLQLFKGAGEERLPDERRLPCFARSTPVARGLARLMRRTPYVSEQLTSLPVLLWRLKVERPDVVFTSEGNLRRWLFLARPWLGLSFRILFSNGGPVCPPFIDSDHVQQVTPYLLDVSLRAGEAPSKHSMVPYGIRVPAGPPAACNAAAKRANRERLGLPLDRPIVLSVGSLRANEHKRMDYTIREVAALPAASRPFLVLLGYQDEHSAPTVALARAMLGAENFLALTVPAALVAEYYLAADVFALGSLLEGFGRVYLEALIAGLPVLAHDHPAMRYVLGEEGTFANLDLPGAMTRLLAETLARPWDALASARRRESVRRRFSWEALAPAYLEMFRRCRFTPLPGRQK